MYETMHHISCCTCRQSPKRNPTAPWSPGTGGERRCNLFCWQPSSSIFSSISEIWFLSVCRCSHSSWQPSALFLPTSSPKQVPRPIHLVPLFTILARSYIFSHFFQAGTSSPSISIPSCSGSLLSSLITSLVGFFMFHVFYQSLSVFPSSFVNFLSITSPG